jgi:hypothetical protein
MNEQQSTPNLEVQKKIAETVGETYVHLVERVISLNHELDDKTIEDLLGDSPEHMKSLLFEGLVILRNEIKKNKVILEKYGGKDKEGIIKDYLKYSKLEEKKVRISCDIDEEIENCTYTELAGGIPLIGLTFDIKTMLSRAGTGSPDGWTTSTSDSGLCFIFYPLPAQMKESELEPWLRKFLNESNFKIKKHELHHIIWSLLERGGFAREPNDDTSELREAFLHIRHELVAHILSESNIKEAIFGFNPKDKPIVDIVNSVIDIISSLRESAKQEGLDQQIFIYSILKSRNFMELRDNILQTAKAYNINV